LVLSGFVIANSYEQKLTSERMSFKEFAVLRVIRIFPYLIGSLIGLVALFLTGTVQNNILALSVILALVMLPLPVRGLPPYPLNNPSWSLFFGAFCQLFLAQSL
jgi:peptidoglycan/LPS O-acetylase OafA/YrhL